jgi:hypothetical protein
MNQASTGYYSVIQYCPDRMRLEAVNVGVLLFSPTHQFLKLRTATSLRRVRAFFGEEADHPKQIRLMLGMLEQRVAAEQHSIRDSEALGHFANILANELVITPPRSVLVESPEIELSHLYEDLVGRFLRHEPKPDAHLFDHVRARFEVPRLKSLVKRDLVIQVPITGAEWKVPYAYQNGCLNLIELHEFNQQRESDVFRDVFSKAAQGHLLANHPDPVTGNRKVILVGAFGKDAAPLRDQIAQVLREHDVTFYADAEFSRLEEQIVATAH